MPEYFIALAKQTLFLALILTGPPVVTALLVGLTISILQATTQVQEQTLTFVPKLVSIVVMLGLIGGLLHYLRFVLISDVPPLAIVIATSLLLATSFGFVSILYAIRWLRLAERNSPTAGSGDEGA